MAKILVLEDDKTRIGCFKHKLFNHDVDYVETSKDAISLLEENKYDVVFLDHDLGGKIYVPSGENTGYEVACWIRDNPSRKPKQIIIHSYNEVGRKNMLAVLPEAEEIPGVWLMEIK